MTAAAADDIEAVAAALWRRAHPHERVLFACLRQTFPDAARARLVESATAVSGWDEVMRVAVRHQVGPLLLHALGQADALHLMPGPTRAALHHEMLRNVAAKAAMRRALREAAAELAGAGLDVMAVKGTSLDLRLRDPALTVSGDVDLLLRQDWSEASPRVHARVAELNAARPVIDVDFARHPDLVLNGVLPVDFPALWASASRTTLDGAPLHLMTLEHELVCACINSVRKRCFRLKSLYEIAELRRGQTALDWDAVLRAARAWRCGGIVYTALRASAAAAHEPLPDLRAGLGVTRPHARLLDGLIARMSFSRLAVLHGGLRLRGKRVGRGLLLPYASLGLRGAVRALAVALRQAAHGARP